jgi:hypothetical protein
METCHKCPDGEFKCNLCSLSFCGESCWYKSNHHLIGTKQNLDEKTEIKSRPIGGLKIKRIWGPHLVECHELDGVQYIFFGERHTNIDELLPKDTLKVKVENNDLIFSGNSQEEIEVTRLMYMIAANSYYKEIKTDIFFELDYNIFKNAELLGYYRQEKEKYTLDKFNHVFETLKCDIIHDCDLYPNVRIHYADVRTSAASIATTDFMLILKNYFGTITKFEKGVFSEDAKNIFSDYFKSLKDDDWYIRYLEMTTKSTNFMEDFLKYFNEDNALMKLLGNLISVIGEKKPSIVILVNTMGKIAYYIAGVFDVAEYKITKIGKQYQALKKENPILADKIYDVLIQQTLYDAKKLAEGEYKDITLLRHFDVLPISAFRKIAQITLILSAINLDLLLLLRMFRNYGESPSKIRISYTGSFHTRRYISVINYLKSGILKYDYFDYKTTNDLPVFVNLDGKTQKIINGLI